MAARERTFAATAIQASGRIIPSPFQFYTTGEDNIRVTSCNSLTGVSLKVNLRTVDSKGNLGAASHDHTPNTNRTAKTSEFTLGPGAVLNITVYANTGTPSIGQTFVIVQLIRGLGAGAIVLGTLLQGYVTEYQALGWPGSPIQTSIEGGGYLRVIVGTQPAAGVDILETVPTGARWQLLAWKSVLTTSAVAGTRRAFFQVTSGGNSLMQLNPAGTQAASQGFQYVWASNLPTLYDGTNGICVQSYPDPLLLLAGETIVSLTTGLLAGDQWSAPVSTVREWLEVN